jgi:hypothetical protein
MTACITSKCKAEYDAVEAFTKDYVKMRASKTKGKSRVIKSLETAYQDLSNCLWSGCLPEMIAVCKGILVYMERKLQKIKERKLTVPVEEVTAIEEFITHGRTFLNKPDIKTDDIREFVMDTLFDGLLLSIISENEEIKQAQAASVQSRSGERSSYLAEVKARKERVSASKSNPKRKRTVL